MNVQYWTVGCERGFVDRVSKIGNGTAGPTRSGEWKSDLRQEKAKLARIMNAIERDVPATM